MELRSKYSRNESSIKLHLKNSNSTIFGFSKPLLVFFTLLIITLSISSIEAQVLYSKEELWAAGDLWKKTQAQWNVEKFRHETSIKKIKDAKLSVVETDLKMNQEFSFHKSQSNKLARQRHQVQNILITETNARVKGGKYKTSEKIKATLGTGIDDPGYKGMKSDLDAQAGELTIKKMKSTLEDMGLDNVLKYKQNAKTPGTFEIEGDFDLCVHKSGIKPVVGEEMHKILIGVDARNPEVYLSERMRNRSKGTKNAGTDYVEAQDHLKKARKGHVATSADLASNKDLMSKMAKGTKKTLDIGNISDDDLGKILKKNGINDSPVDFKKKLADIKTNDYTVKTSREAAKIRDASIDIFKKADFKGRLQAAKDFKLKRERLAKLKEKIAKIDAMSDNPKTKARKEKLRKSIKSEEYRIREEIIDSKAKMEASKAANNEFFNEKGNLNKGGNEGASKTKTHQNKVDSGDTPSKTKTTDIDKVNVDVDINVKGPDVYNKVKNVGAKGLKTFGDFMDIVDIGNACKKLQEYQEGKAELSEVVRAVVDMTPVGTIIGTGEKVYGSTTDYLEKNKKIKEANENNMIAYLDQWNVQLRKAGLSKNEARKYVAAAVLGGNFNILENKAELLKLEGIKINKPKLVVEKNLGPDGGSWYMWENTKDLATGMKKSAKEGAEYIVTAPGRILVSWAEGELNEATLDFDSKTATSAMKTRLFRKLLNAGIDRDRALEAVQGTNAQLRAVSKEAAEKLQKIRDEQQKILDEQKKFDESLNACMLDISRLRFADAFIKTNPTSPLKIPAGTDNEDVFPVVVSLGGDFVEKANFISRLLGNLTGKKPAVTYSYEFSVKNTKKITPSSWEVEVPGKVGSYPVKIRVSVSITSFPGMYKPIKRTITRTINGVIQVKPTIESIHFTKDKYEISCGFSEELKVTISDKAPKGDYFFYWTIDGKSFTTTEPSTNYIPKFNKKECPVTVKASVLLCDKNSGSLLDETATQIKVIYEEVDTNSESPLDGVWEIDENSEIISTSGFSESTKVSYAKDSYKDLTINKKDLIVDQVLRFFHSKKVYIKKMKDLNDGFEYYYMYQYLYRTSFKEEGDSFDRVIIKRLNNSDFELYGYNYKLSLKVKQNSIICIVEYIHNEYMYSYKYIFKRKKTPKKVPTLENGNWDWDELTEDFTEDLEVYLNLSEKEKSVTDLEALREKDDFSKILERTVEFNNNLSIYLNEKQKYTGINASLLEEKDLYWKLVNAEIINRSTSRPYFTTDSSTEGWVKYYIENENSSETLVNPDSEYSSGGLKYTQVSEYRWNPPKNVYKVNEVWDLNIKKSGSIRAEFEEIVCYNDSNSNTNVVFSLKNYNTNYFKSPYPIELKINCNLPDIYADFNATYQFELHSKKGQ